MPTDVLIYLFAGALAGGFINGLAGFGTALLALGFWLQVMSPAEAVGLSAALSVVSGVQGVWVVRSEILRDHRRLWRFLGPALPAIPLGGLILTFISASALKLVIAAMMVLYGAFFAFRRNLPSLARPWPMIDRVIGFAGGFLGGAAALSGALPTMWCALQPWSKAETRAVLQPFNVAVLTLTVLSLAFYGFYTPQTLWRLLMAVPVALLGAQIGLRLYRHLNDTTFRRLLIVMMLIAGVLVAVRELPAWG